MKTVLITGFVTAWAAALRQDYQMPKPQKEHQWLKQIVGEWDSECEMFMEEGQPPQKSKGTESGKMLGEFWAMLENKGEFQGKPFVGHLTIGYDADKKQFVGTWVDNMSHYLWQYTGKRDSAGKALTLETEGPCPGEGGKIVKIREILELKTPEHKVFTSMREKDGKWIKGMVINYRKRAGN
jgi:hypothetical protein